MTWSLDQQATASAIEEAKHTTREVARAAVVPDLRDGLLTGDPAAIAAMDRIVRERVLNERVVRVKIWSHTGTILYSDEPRLIGSTFPLEPADANSLRTGVLAAHLSDLTRPENRYERGYGQLLEVYLRIHTPSQQALLFENYVRYDAVTDRSRRLLLGLLPSMLGGLVLLELALLPLAWQLARRVREGQRERHRLVQRAVPPTLNGGGSRPTSMTPPSRSSRRSHTHWPQLGESWGPPDTRRPLSRSTRPHGRLAWVSASYVRCWSRSTRPTSTLTVWRSPSATCWRRSASPACERS